MRAFRRSFDGTRTGPPRQCWVAKSMELFRARATVRPGPRVLMKSASLAQAHQQLRAIVSGGVSLSGKQWDRSDDTNGIAGVINGIFSTHAAYFNGGGVGIVLGDGMLPHPGLEQIIETYYSYALSSSTKLTFDYQFIANAGYNTDRGPVNVFGGRFHTQFRTTTLH